MSQISIFDVFQADDDAARYAAGPGNGARNRHGWAAVARRHIGEPCLFRTDTLSPLTHLPWEIGSTAPGYQYTGSDELPAGSHFPTMLNVHTRPFDLDEAGPGDWWSRGGCLGCEWEGPIHCHDGRNDAIEDALDHTWPGWATMPVITHRLDTAHQIANAKATYDKARPGWWDNGGPVRTLRKPGQTAHHYSADRYNVGVEPTPTAQTVLAAQTVAVAQPAGLSR